jgi:hypothetical protein
VLEWRKKKTEFEAILNDLLTKGIEGRETFEKSALIDQIEAHQKEHADVCISELESEMSKINGDA